MGVLFFRKNKYDLSNTIPVTTITDAVASDTCEDYVDFMRNRNNTSGWATTDSTDAANTQIDVDFIDQIEINRIILIGHNFKNYTIQYWNGSTYVDFSTAVNVSNNTASSTFHTFNTVTSSRIRIIITGAQTVDADKYLKQLIVTEILGELSEQMLLNPEINRSRRTTKFLSGKSFVSKSTGAFNLRMSKQAVASSDDMALIEMLFDSYEGFLVWPCGGDETQFEQVRQGYRLEDIFLMALANEYEPNYVEGRWKHGLEVDLRLVEVV